jgi:hypothetical protein
MRPIRVKATFLFHCAFVHGKDSPSVSVLLSASDKDDPLLKDHHMVHIASLRIPETCVADDSQLPGEEQHTETLDRRVTTDLLWPLKGYDVWIDRPDEEDGDGATKMIGKVRDDAGTDWIVADFKELTGVGVDRRMLAEDNVPDIIREGARVQVWGGVMRAGTPDKELKTRRWVVLDQENVGLSDRMEYEKTIDTDRPIAVHFRPFEGDRTVKTVFLRPNADTGIIRLHVTNDPTPNEVHDLGRDPCAKLPHFASYDRLLYNNGVRRSPLTAPQPDHAHMAKSFTVLEGESLCCPCGGAPPEP